jgi:DNA helicase II / ATP-dependent DNA helicase PcrA
MNEFEQQSEQERLGLVMRQIEAQIKESGNVTRDYRQEVADTLSQYWEKSGIDLLDEAQMVETLKRQKQISGFFNSKRKRLEKMYLSPYFGRIDFTEDGKEEPERIYIGISSLFRQETGESLIYDWRTPIAGMFYDCEPGRVEYPSPSGAVSGAMGLKRQYRIKDGRIELMFDCALKIDDPILQEVLGKHVDDRMRTIVTSIQREQNRAIRDEGHRLLVVEGPAGSGKTSIALHRAAYLLYRERDSITSKNILVFSPNRIFSDYISNVLPDLGEENILQATFAEYLDQLGRRFGMKTEEWSGQLEYLFAAAETPEYMVKTAGIRYKSSPDFALVLRNYLVFMEKNQVRDYPEIVYQDHLIFPRAEWENLFHQTLLYLPVSRRLSQIERRIHTKLHPLSKELARRMEEKLADTGEYVNEQEIKGLSRLAARQELEPLTAKVADLTAINPLAVYRNLFADEDLFRQLATGTVIPGNWGEIRRQTLESFQNGYLPYEDQLALFYLQGSLEGFPAQNNIRHLIIDEAQDYTILQYEIFKRLFPQGAWTVLGDPDQSVHPFLRLGNLETVARILETTSLLVRLGKSYRSTREIFAFCRAILANEGELINPVNRPGMKPIVVQALGPEAMLECIARDLKRLAGEGYHSIAIIGKTAAACTAIHEKLKSRLDIALISNDDEMFRRGLTIIPVYLAKGLEFDVVFIYDAGTENYHRDFDRNLLYTACTRALHRLNLYTAGQISPFLSNIRGDLWETGHVCYQR